MVGKGQVFFYLRLDLVYLRLVFVAYGELAWSFLLTVQKKVLWSFLNQKTSTAVNGQIVL